MSGKRKRSKSKNQSRRNYAVSVLMLIALVGAAFCSPGWLFWFQDSRQYSNTVLEERENVDVAVLSTNYETSFYQRMINFAENQANHTNYYVASEELTDYQELRKFLDSESGLNNERIWALIETGMISNHIYESEIKAWKQYVIYSDDYAKGVNFILWYIELEGPGEDIGTYKLLVEANTGELYGLHADTGGTAVPYAVSYGKKYSLADFWGFASEVSYIDAWRALAYIYSGLTESDFFQFYDLYYSAVSRVHGDVSAGSWRTAAAASEYAALQKKMGIEDSQWIDYFRTNVPRMIVWDDGNCLGCSFPYGERQLSFRLQMAESVSYSWTLRGITIGFPAIYSLIPEFE